MNMNIKNIHSESVKSKYIECCGLRACMERTVRK